MSARLEKVIIGALSASVVFTAAAGTRYRAPFEPVIAILASVAGVAAFDRLSAR